VTNDFSAVWNAFCNELETRNSRLHKEIEGCWKSLDSILQKQAEKLILGDWGNLPKDTLQSILDVIRGKSSDLLFGPMILLRKARSLERVTSAVENYPNDIEDLLRLLPATLEISRNDLAGCLSLKGRSVGDYVFGFGKSSRLFYVRDAARQVLYRHLNERIQWDGRAILLLARASLSLLIPWELFRNETLRAAGDTQNPFRDLSQERDEWLKEVSDLRADAARILAAFDVLDRRLPERLARVLLSGRKKFSGNRQN